VPIEDELADLENKLQAIDNELESNKLEMKRLRQKIQQNTATEDGLRQVESLKAANKVLASRKKGKDMMPRIPILEKE